MYNKEELQKRLKAFALDTLKIVKSLPLSEENRIYGRQVIRSSSSIGANYAEALYAHSKQDFIHSINLSRKEASETLYWLEMIQSANKTVMVDGLMDESSQILKIFISSVKTAKERVLQNGK